MNYGLILSGGSGTRLWPLSNTKTPKQFLQFANQDHTLIQDTFLRLNQGNIDQENIWVILNQKHEEKVREQFSELGIEKDKMKMLLEPQGKNTAPAILWSALVLHEGDSQARVAVMPSDHIIQNKEAFNQVLSEAFEQADKGYIVTFGIEPTFPETGFGYIKMGDTVSGRVRKVLGFVEKPDFQTAQAYLKEGIYSWNSGMFVFPVPELLDCFKTYTRPLWDVFQEAKKKIGSSWKDPRVAQEAFSHADSISIDYAIMEKTENVVVIPCELDWSDLGSWEAVYKNGLKEAGNNHLRGDVIALDTKNSLIHSSQKLITTIGLEDVIIVETEDSILVCNRKQSQDVKKIVEALKEKGRSEI